MITRRVQGLVGMSLAATLTGCHLPARVWMNVHFNTDKDRYIPPIRRYQHRIGVYPEATQEVLLAWEKKRPDGDGAGAEQAGKLTKQLVAHWLAEADKYRKDFRFHSEIKAVREAKLNVIKATSIEAISACEYSARISSRARASAPAG